MLIFDPESYRETLGIWRGQPLTDQEWATLDAWLIDMGRSTVHQYADHAMWLANRVAEGFNPDLRPEAIPLATQAMQWQAQQLGIAMGNALEGLRQWAEETSAKLAELAKQITEAIHPEPPPAIDPPPARPEARNENRPRQKHESPRWQPRRRK